MVNCVFAQNISVYLVFFHLPLWPEYMWCFSNMFSVLLHWIRNQRHVNRCLKSIYFICSEAQQRLIQLEDAAKAEGKGKWAPQEEQLKHVRKVTWTIENPRLFVDSHHQKPIDGVYRSLYVQSLSQVLAVATNGMFKCINFMVQTFSCSCHWACARWLHCQGVFVANVWVCYGHAVRN